MKIVINALRNEILMNAVRARKVIEVQEVIEAIKEMMVKEDLNKQNKFVY